MGWELNLIIGETGTSGDEYEQDFDKPFDDGSGYPTKHDAEDKPIPTGRKTHYFSVFGTVNLCKPGYDSAIYKLAQDTASLGKRVAATAGWYFYDWDGNQQITFDRYGAPLYPVPLHEVIITLQRDAKSGYRRFTWALALLQAVAKNQPTAKVLLYGY